MPAPSVAQRFLAVARLSVLAGLTACGGGGGSAERPSVLLVVVDTLRFDRLGCHGYARPTTPSIDAFATRAVRFEEAYSAAPWTMPAVASLLTGRYPRSHGVTKIGRRLPEGLTTLAEVFRRRGYATAAVTSNTLLKRRSQFDSGFATYNDKDARGHDFLSTPGVTEKAARLLERFAKEDEPFFLSLLYFDPHYNYRHHAESDFAAKTAGRLVGGDSIHDLRRWTPELTAEERQFVRDLYDEEVRFTDRGIGELLAKLDALGLADDTIVVLTADHGEGFWEREWLGHTNSLYQELVRVPLLVRDPRLPGGRVAPGPVSTVSLAATLVDLAGFDPAELPFQAPSLRPWLEQDLPRSKEPVFCEVSFEPIDEELNEESRAHLRAVIADGYKLIRDDLAGTLELYDLAADPGELRNLAAAEPERAAALLARLDAHTAALVQARAEVSEAPLTPADVADMQDLGYAE